MNHHPLSRESIIAGLLAGLEPLEEVLLVWEGGSAAFDRMDEFSDIDLYIMVRKGTTAKVLKAVEESLVSLSFILMKYVPNDLPWPGVSQAFYKLEGAPPHLLLDLAMIEEGSPEQFLDVEAHGRAKFYLTREEVTLPHIDMEELTALLKTRVVSLQNRFMMFSPFLEKEIERGNLIDALETYRRVFLDTLVALLRIRYCPALHDFGAIRIHHDLPAGAVRRLEGMFLVRSMEDMKTKSVEARGWISDLLSEIESDGVDNLVGRSLNP